MLQHGTSSHAFPCVTCRGLQRPQCVCHTSLVVEVGLCAVLSCFSLHLRAPKICAMACLILADLEHHCVLFARTAREHICFVSHCGFGGGGFFCSRVQDFCGDGTEEIRAESQGEGEDASSLGRQEQISSRSRAWGGCSSGGRAWRDGGPQSR